MEDTSERETRVEMHREAERDHRNPYWDDSCHRDACACQVEEGDNSSDTFAVVSEPSLA